MNRPSIVDSYRASGELLPLAAVTTPVDRIQGRRLLAFDPGDSSTATHSPKQLREFQKELPQLLNRHK